MSKIKIDKSWLLVLTALGLLTLSAAWVFAAPTSLWLIVSTLCVPDQLQMGKPFPCEEVDIAGGIERGSAVLADPLRKTHLLVVPTVRIAGIEDPKLLAAQAPNYWEAAWRARSVFASRAGKAIPRDDLALAVNSIPGRSQDQLHIHLDCVNADVRATLRREERLIAPSWSRFKERLEGRQYLAMRIEGEEFGSIDPFRLLAEKVPGAATDMGNWTLVAIGATFSSGKSGFYILADRAEAATEDYAVGEQLLDHRCRVLATK